MTTDCAGEPQRRMDREIHHLLGRRPRARMEITITVAPTTVSFQALEIMEDTCGRPERSTNYSTKHAPTNNETPMAGRVWRQGATERLSDPPTVWDSFALGTRPLHLGIRPLRKRGGHNIGNRSAPRAMRSSRSRRGRDERRHDARRHKRFRSPERWEWSRAIRRESGDRPSPLSRNLVSRASDWTEAHVHGSDQGFGRAGQVCRTPQ